MPRLRAWLAATFGALALLFALAWPAAAERRVALVIGNSSYKNVVALSNPRNDAEDVANKLRDLGFEVMMQTNVEKANIRTVFRDFSRRMSEVAADVALVYYAGHALQYQNRSYIMPVDASLEDEFSITFDMVSEDFVRTELNRIKGVRIMIFDGCRNDPFQPKPGQATPTPAPVDVSGTVTVYATSPFELAEDGKARNSPFTRALLKQLAEPGLDITQIFRRVARDVRDQTQGRQKPEILVALDKPFVFNQGASDRTAWAKIRHSSDPSDFRDFISRFPASAFVPDARFRLDVLTRQGRAIEEARRQDEERQKAVALAKAQEDERRRREEALRRVCEQEAASVASLAGNRNKAELARLKANAQCTDTVGRVDFVLAEIATAEAQARAEVCRREGLQIEAAQQAGRPEDLQALAGSAQCLETPARLQTALAAIAAARAEAQRKAEAEARAREIAEACTRESALIAQVQGQGAAGRAALLALRDQWLCPNTPGWVTAALSALATAEAEAKARAEEEARTREQAERCQADLAAVEAAVRNRSRAAIQALRGRSTCPEVGARIDVALADIEAAEAAEKQALARTCQAERDKVAALETAGDVDGLDGLRGAALCPDTPRLIVAAVQSVRTCQAERDKVAALETAGDVGELEGLRGATLCPATPHLIEAAVQLVRTRQERVCTAELAAFEPIKTSEADLERFVATATCDLVKGRAISQLSSLRLARENCEQETATLERLRQSGTPAEIADFKRVARCPSVISIVVDLPIPPTETPVGPTPPPVTVPPAVNTRLLVERAQKALTRVSCYDGDADGSFGPKTVSALERYLKAKDDDTTAPEVTEPLVARLEAEPRRRVCPLICPSGQRVSRNGSRCERIASEPRSPRGSGGSATGPNAPRPTGGNGGSGARPTPPSPPPAAPQPPRIGVIIGGG